MTMKMKLFWLKMGQRLGRLTNWLFWSLIGSQRYLSSDWLKWPNQINQFENPKSDSDLFAKERQKLEKSENRKNSDCDVIESLKILNKADGQINFFPIIQKILLSSEFQSFDIRKTALPGTICILPKMSHPYDSSPMSCDRFQVGSCFHNEIMYLMHEKSRATKIKCKSIFESDSLFNRKTFRNQLWPQLDRLGKLNYSHIKS